ncbi:MAG: hypothetical protein AB2421_17775 [Thermotaleaceae bacterium]
MEKGFCLILTKYRLYQGLTLYHSLCYNMESPQFFILCMDEEVHDTLLKLHLKNVTLIPVHQLENETLLALKQERKLNEYCWTLKPVLLEYVFEHYPHVGLLTYVDSDIAFFNNPAPIYNESDAHSVMLSRHNYTKSLDSIEPLCGTYNSGFLVFKRDINGLDALKWWKKKCLDWCFDYVEKNKFGDQKYLDAMGYKFKGVGDIKTPGVNVGPWNDSRYKTNIHDGSVYINNVKLIFYHFAGLRLLSPEKFTLILTFNNALYQDIYVPYIKVLQRTITEVAQMAPHFQGFYGNETAGSKTFIVPL